MKADEGVARPARPRAPRATLQMIAERVGVSKSAVSLALNKRGRLSAEVRERIQEVAEELGYAPRRKPRPGEPGTPVRLGVLLDRRFFWPNESYFTRITRGVEEEAASRGYQTLFTTVSDEQLSVPSQLPFADAATMGGLIVVGITHPGFLKHLNSFEAPTVLVACGRVYDHRHDVVLHDDFEGMEQVFDHLARLGHRRIAFLGGGLEHLSGTDRMRGYKIQMDELAGGHDPAAIILAEGATDQAAGEAGCARLLALRPRPTAIVCATDEMAAGAIRESQRQGLRVPADISIIGFDNKPLAAALNPPLTTVQISCEEMGRVATELLSMRLSGLSVAHALRVFIGSDLVVRSSTGPAPRE